jgi:hypothetical protein
VTELLSTPDLAASLEVSAEVRLRVETSLLDTRAASTRRNYTWAWLVFEEYCRRQGHQALPAHPHVVADYLLALENTVDVRGRAAYSISAIEGAAAAIKFVHKAHSPNQQPNQEETPLWLSPVVAGTLSAIRRGNCRQRGVIRAGAGLRHDHRNLRPARSSGHPRRPTHPVPQNSNRARIGRS